MVAHPRSANGALCFIVKFRLDRIYGFGDRSIFIFLAFLLEIANSRLLLGGFGSSFPQMMSSIVVTPKRHFLARKQVVWAIKRKHRSSGLTWSRAGEKNDRTGQDRTVQKVAKALYTDFRQNLHSSCCSHIITCANFWTKIFRGYDFTGGRTSRFPIDSNKGLTTLHCDIQFHVIRVTMSV